MKYPAKVRDLIAKLEGFSPDAFVHVLFEGDLIPIDDIRNDEEDETCVFIAIEENA